MKRALLILIPLLVLSLFSCSTRRNSTIRLWTNRPEIAAYVEEFNSSQEELRVEIEYTAEPGRELTSAGIPADMVIAEHLDSPELINLFRAVKEKTDEESGGLDSSVIYSDLLERGRTENGLVIIPLSFNLPLIMFKRDMLPENIPSFYINETDMKESALIFNEGSSDKFQIMGFSPRWNSEFLLIHSILGDTGFRQIASGVLSWDEDNLQTALNTAVSWDSGVNESYEHEREFAAKFLYDPSYKLIDQERILFYYSDLVSFFEIAPEKRRTLDFRWLSSDDRIPVPGTILYAGIPAEAENPKGAQVFTEWLMNRDTQKQLLKSSQLKRMDTFGFAGGFSSLPDINKIELPIIYPALVGAIPPEEALEFPNPLPLYWEELKESVIKPWLLNKTGDTPTERTLGEEIEEWMKNRPR